MTLPCPCASSTRIWRWGWSRRSARTTFCTTGESLRLFTVKPSADAGELKIDDPANSFALAQDDFRVAPAGLVLPRRRLVEDDGKRGSQRMGEISRQHLRSLDQRPVHLKQGVEAGNHWLKLGGKIVGNARLRARPDFLQRALKPRQRHQSEIGLRQPRHQEADSDERAYALRRHVERLDSAKPEAPSRSTRESRRPSTLCRCADRWNSRPR